MKPYDGSLPIADFYRLQAQDSLFSAPLEDPFQIKRKLEALARVVIEDLGRDAQWIDLKETLKSRAAGKVLYNADSISAALDHALRLRGKGPK
jgi:hypothetical protein